MMQREGFIVWCYDCRRTKNSRKTLPNIAGARRARVILMCEAWGTGRDEETDGYDAPIRGLTRSLSNKGM